MGAKGHLNREPRRVEGFPGSSVGKESACNAGDPSSIPGLGRSAGEGIGYPLQYSWASLGAQLVKKLPAMRETCVPSLGWEDPLEKGKATHSSIMESSMDSVHGVTKSQTRLSDFHLSLVTTIPNPVGAWGSVTPNPCRVSFLWLHITSSHICINTKASA